MLMESSRDEDTCCGEDFSTYKPRATVSSVKGRAIDDTGGELEFFDCQRSGFGYCLFICSRMKDVVKDWTQSILLP